MPNTVKSNFLDKYILFILIFSLLFVHRYDIYDVTFIIFSLVFISFCFSSHKLYFPKKRYSQLIFYLFFLFAYCILIQLLFVKFDFYLLFRVLRVILYLIILPTIIFKLKPSIELILQLLLISILIHSIIVFLQVLYPDSMLILFAEYSNISLKNILLGKDEDILIRGRGFGLASSFDMAGIVNILGMLSSSYLYKINVKNKYYYLLCILIFYIAGIFTGRTFIVLGSFILFWILFKIFFYGNMAINKFYITIVVLLSAPFVIQYINLLIIPTVKFFLTGQVDETISITSAGIQGMGYYLGTFEVIIRQLQLPQDWTTFLLGGQDLRDSAADAGIVKITYAIGIFGFLLHFFLYIKIYYIFKRFSNHIFHTYFIIPLFISLFIFDLKYIVYLSRGLTEIILILLIIVITSKNENWHNS